MCILFNISYSIIYSLSKMSYSISSLVLGIQDNASIIMQSFSFLINHQTIRAEGKNVIDFL
jgi:hypothetical protein